jgi:hypothetical protein
MHTHTQGLLHKRATLGTSLAGVTWINQYDATTGTLSLVRRVLHQLMPSGVSNALGQVAVLEQVPNIQIFKGNQAKLIDQTAA